MILQFFFSKFCHNHSLSRIRNVSLFIGISYWHKRRSCRRSPHHSPTALNPSLHTRTGIPRTQLRSSRHHSGALLLRLFPETKSLSVSALRFAASSSAATRLSPKEEGAWLWTSGLLQKYQQILLFERLRISHLWSATGHWISLFGRRCSL